MFSTLQSSIYLITINKLEISHNISFLICITKYIIFVLYTSNFNLLLTNHSLIYFNLSLIVLIMSPIQINNCIICKTVILILLETHMHITSICNKQQ